MENSLYRSLSNKDNLVVLLNDGSHICTCLEAITKGIICRYFWRVMLYSNIAKFHISIIPIRWDKDGILVKLDEVLENSPVLTVLKSSADDPIQANFTLEMKQNSRSKDNSEEVQSADNDGIIALQQNLINETNDPHVTKIRGAPNKQRIKSAIEVSKKKIVMHEITNNNSQEIYNEESSSRSQRKCLLCGTPGHIKKIVQILKE
ncbi:hypothetical protein C2G38_2047034 [Gigaspora rosea]|uniref:SWIM-type domain-containing protein n=1 Tax=Gigaspora rosea TaxID=44941 RepID=A0A397UAR2_9GLOM|nr:hypothetical protein C2G38_2047034 [Gigaspora rosea]